MAAAATLLQSLPVGARVLFHTDIYSGVRQLALDFLPRWGMVPIFANLADAGAVEAALAQEAALVWAETPANPQLEILDLRRLAAAVHAAGALLLVDGTFATPALQRPLTLGADLVLHSTTKYLGGHSDVLGGALVFAGAGTNDGLAILSATVGKARRRLGGAASPFNSWLVLRGLRSLSCRVERHSANALSLARALSGHPALSHVLYPGLSTHPGHEVAASQMTAFGGMLALRLAGGRAAALAVASRLEAVHQRHQPRRPGEPGRAPRFERRSGNDDAGRSLASVDRSRAPGRPPGRPAAGARTIARAGAGLSGRSSGRSADRIGR